MKSEVLVLKGEHSKVTREGHSITGTKFTLQRSDGKITAESSRKNRVKAVFHPPEKDYVNMAKTCLHLWRWTKGEIPRPPKFLVG